MQIPFAKLHGLGNDFIVVLPEGLPRSLPRLARAICRRTTGVGADGLLILTPALGKKSRARLRIFNADGSEAEMSGNGIRCAAAFALAHGLARSPFVIETLAGTKTLHLVRGGQNRWTFGVSMGRPILVPAKIPFSGAKGEKTVVGFPLRTSRGDVAATVSSMGNPHCSIFVDDFAALDWPALGREIENDRLFPNRTNVEFVKVLSRKEIEVRFWERGVGITNSSGTGSCAATVAAIVNRRTGRRVCVQTLTGALDVEWPVGGEVYLTGPAELIAEGAYVFNL